MTLEEIDNDVTMVISMLQEVTAARFGVHHSKKDAYWVGAKVTYSCDGLYKVHDELQKLIKNGGAS